MGSTLKWNTGDDAYVDIPDVVFSEPVHKLVITNDGQYDVAIDNLRVETWQTGSPVPEPATFLLLGAGLAGFGLARRRVRG